MKENAAIKVVSVNETEEGILSDDIIQLKNRRPGGGRINHYANKDLRRITLPREDKKTPLVIVTNDMARSAKEIGKLYKDRWQIELLFKRLKQKLKLKTFFGSSRNAVLLQIYAALITYILMVLEHKRSGFDGTLSSFYLSFRFGLFQRAQSEYYLYKNRRKTEKERQDRQYELGLVF